MKPLNRPMFRYGGPIKEGVMSGIREPKKNGGLSKQFNTGLVGDERYPKTDGREHHYFFLPALGTAAMTGLRMLAPRAIAAGARAFGRGVAAKPTASGAKGIFNVERLKSLLPSARFRQPVTPKGYNLGYRGQKPPIGSTYQAAPLSFREIIRSPEMIGRAVRENPISTFLAAGQIKNIPAIGMGAAGIAKDIGQSGVNYLLGTEFGKNKPPEIDSNLDPNLGKTTKELAESKTGTGTGTEKGAGSGAELSPKEKRAKKIQEYRDIMDIKGMNKAAAYDSLIAASQAVNQAGGDLKGAIRDGSLINQIIQSTSKAFDKPAKTKEGIDTLILKGEIEKDIKASDPSNQILNELRAGQLKKINKELEGSNFAENKAVIKKAGGSGQSGINDAAALNNEDYRGNLVVKTDLDKVIKGKKEEGILDDKEIVVSYTNTLIEGKDLADGDYTVGDYLVTIKDSKVFDIAR